MERKLTMLGPFFEDPASRQSIRELARALKINHTTVRQHLNKLVEEGYLSSAQEGVYTFYKLVTSNKTLNLKLFYNLEKIRKSGIVDDLENAYDYPVIALFGSYANAMDDKTSDVDICVISNVKKEIPHQKYKRVINRELSLHIFSRKKWSETKKKNPGLVNNICNGIVLSGELAVL